MPDFANLPPLVAAARKIDEAERVISHEEVSRRLFHIGNLLESIAMVEPDYETCALLDAAIRRLQLARSRQFVMSNGGK